MLLPVIKSLRCDISQQYLRLSLGDQMLNTTTRQPDQALKEQLIALIKPHISRFSWGKSIEFSLDSALTNQLVAPWQDGINTPAELRRYSALLATKRFPQLTGKQFHTGFIDYGYRKNALVAIIENEVWQELQTSANHLKLRLQGIQTPLRSLLETWRTKLPDAGIFATVGETSSTFAFRLESEWQRVFHLAFPGISASKQLALVARLAGVQNMTCHYWDKHEGRKTISLRND